MSDSTGECLHRSNSMVIPPTVLQVLPLKIIMFMALPGWLQLLDLKASFICYTVYENTHQNKLEIPI